MLPVSVPGFRGQFWAGFARKRPSDGLAVRSHWPSNLQQRCSPIEALKTSVAHAPALGHPRGIAPQAGTPRDALSIGSRGKEGAT